MAEEDLTTYTEVDPAADLTVTAGDVTVATVRKDEVAYVYADKGAGAFDGDFAFLFELKQTAAANTGKVAGPCLANSLGGIITIQDAAGDLIGVELFDISGTPTAYLFEIDAGTFYNATGLSLTEGTQYWITFERDEAVGSFGTIYARFYTDSSRTTEVSGSPKSLALHTSKKDFRYVYAFQSAGETGVQDWSGVMGGLDLQGAGGGGGASVLNMGGRKFRGHTRGLVRGGI